jgi:hypothetical protein
LMRVDLVFQSDWFKAVLWQLADPLCLDFVAIRHFPSVLPREGKGLRQLGADCDGNIDPAASAARLTNVRTGDWSPSRALTIPTGRALR